MSPASTAPTRTLPSTTTPRSCPRVRRKPRDKAKVEVAVQIVERFVLARLRNRRFFSLDELNAAIRETVARPQRQDHAQARRQPRRAVRRDRSAGAQSPSGDALSVCRVEEVPGRARLPRRDRRSLLLRAVAPDPRATRGAHHRHHDRGPAQGRRVLRAMPVLMRAVGTRRFPSTCRARTGATPSGRRPG